MTLHFLNFVQVLHCCRTHNIAKHVFFYVNVKRMWNSNFIVCCDVTLSITYKKFTFDYSSVFYIPGDSPLKNSSKIIIIIGVLKIIIIFNLIRSRFSLNKFQKFRIILIICKIVIGGISKGDTFLVFIANCNDCINFYNFLNRIKLLTSYLFFVVTVIYQYQKFTKCPI